jgi:hypothetical protein
MYYGSTRANKLCNFAVLTGLAAEAAAAAAEGSEQTFADPHDNHKGLTNCTLTVVYI